MLNRKFRYIWTAVALTALIGLLLTGCSSQPDKPKEAQKETPKEAAAPPPPPPAEEKKEAKKEEKAAPKEEKKEEAKAGPVFNVKMATTKGDIVIEVHRDWAPLGAQRFHDLVKDKFYDDAGFFRVVPNFVVQFGLAADPAKTKKWDKVIKDDPVVRTNATGTVVFATAGPNTRTTQLFINLKSNQNLDSQGFAPFGKVVQGMDVVEKINASYGERPDQGAITARGNAYLKAQFPNLDFIKKAVVQ